MSKPITPEQLAASGTEDGEQAALFCYAVDAARHDYRWGLLYAIPNGGSRGDSKLSRTIRGGRMKATGTKDGFPDVGLPSAMGGFHALYVELKTRKEVGKRGQLIGGGAVQAKQTAWHDALTEEGNAVAICYGWIEAKNTIHAYLNGDIFESTC